MSAAAPPQAPRAARVLAAEVLDEVRGIVREPVTLVFSVAMPVGFFALFASLYGSQDAGGLSVGTRMLATFGTFGVVGVALLTPGIGVAEDRERGWLRAKRVSATPLATTLGAKVAATLPHAIAVLVAMTLVAAAVAGTSVGLGTWLRLAGVLVIGALPFALLGMAVGFSASPNATTAILNAVFIPSAVASGLWMPLDSLPDVVQRVAPALPTYHLAQLALGQLDGSGGLDHLLALLATAGGAAVLAALAYRRLQP